MVLTRISQYDDELQTVRDELGALTRLGSKKSVDVARCDKAMIDDLGIDVKTKRFPPAVTSDGAPAALKEHARTHGSTHARTHPRTHASAHTPVHARTRARTPFHWKGLRHTSVM